jgi:hypothetical protein
MARKVGQIIARGDRRWLVRVYRGRDHETNKRNYHNRTIHGSMREAQAYLTRKYRSSWDMPVRRSRWTLTLTFFRTCRTKLPQRSRQCSLGLGERFLTEHVLLGTRYTKTSVAQL